MAATFAVARIAPLELVPHDVSHWREVICEVTASGTYSGAGGDSLTAATFGLQKILFFSAELNELSATTGFVPRYDYANSKLKFYKANGTTDLTEVGAVSVAGTFRCRVVGI